MDLYIPGVKFKDYHLVFRPLTMKNKPEYIILHHALWHTCSIVDIHKDHLKRKTNKGELWSGVGYHFLIRKSGIVEIGRPLNAVGGHCKEEHMNWRSIGICFEGNYTDFRMQNIDYEMSPAQYKAAVKLIKGLMIHFNILYHKVMPHSYYAHYKDCPGKYFPLTTLIGDLAKRPKMDHWAEDLWKDLNDKGITIHEKRFDEAATRAEMIALNHRVYSSLMKEISKLKGGF